MAATSGNFVQEVQIFSAVPDAREEFFHDGLMQIHLTAGRLTLKSAGMTKLKAFQYGDKSSVTNLPVDFAQAPQLVFRPTGGVGSSVGRAVPF